MVPIALPRRWVEVLEPTVEKNDDLGLVPIFKQKSQKSVIFIFSPSIYVQTFKAIKQKCKYKALCFSFLIVFFLYFFFLFI